METSSFQLLKLLFAAFLALVAVVWAVVWAIRDFEKLSKKRRDRMDGP